MTTEAAPTESDRAEASEDLTVVYDVRQRLRGRVARSPSSARQSHPDEMMPTR
jgi:hypothetical protein